MLNSLTLTLILAASAGLAHADTMTLKLVSAINFPFVGGSANGLHYIGKDVDEMVYQSSNPLGNQVFSYGALVNVSSGALLSQTASSWTFAGGTFLAEGTIFGF